MEQMQIFYGFPSCPGTLHPVSQIRLCFNAIGAYNCLDAAGGHKKERSRKNIYNKQPFYVSIALYTCIYIIKKRNKKEKCSLYIKKETYRPQTFEKLYRRECSNEKKIFTETIPYSFAKFNMLKRAQYKKAKNN